MIIWGLGSRRPTTRDSWVVASPRLGSRNVGPILRIVTIQCLLPLRAQHALPSQCLFTSEDKRSKPTSVELEFCCDLALARQKILERLHTLFPKVLPRSDPRHIKHAFH